MNLPAAPLDFPQRDISQRLKNHSLKTAEELQAALEHRSAERVLALGIPALDEVLPHRGLLQGSVIELQVHGASGAATSFALCACRAAQLGNAPRDSVGQSSVDQSSVDQGSIGPVPLVRGGGVESRRQWCAFIDTSASLFAPGIARLGVALDRLLVVRPSIDAVERVAVRIAEARAMSLLVIDLRGALGDLQVSSHRWSRTVRRLALAVKQLATCVLLITSADRQTSFANGLPLPVAMRLEFSRASADSFEVRVGKERSGRVSAARAVPWSAFDEVGL